MQIVLYYDFSLNPNDEEVDGVNGMEQAYLTAIQLNLL